MTTEAIVAIVSNIIILISILFTFFYQKEKIKSLQTALQSQSSILDAVKTYADIFKIDELRKYVALSEENAKRESDKKIRDFADMMKKDTRNLAVQSGKQVGELIGFSYGLLLKLPPEMRETIVKNGMSDGDHKTSLLTQVRKSSAFYYPPTFSVITELLTGKQ
jgi:hypothetical protein